MCLSALQSTVNNCDDDSGPQRLLLLLATKNADKASAPAAHEHRLAMMGAFAEDLKRRLRMERAKNQNEVAVDEEGKRKADGDAQGVEGRREMTGHGVKELAGGAATAKPTTGGEEEDQDVIIDIGVTKEAIFVEKAKTIEDSGLYVYPLREKGEVEQIHLTGYDTLVRLVDPKYYPPRHVLAPLQGLFEKHRVRVTMRTPPSAEEQMKFVNDLEEGGREAQGWKREWAERIELVEGRGKGEEGISSTKARESFRDLGLRQTEGRNWCSDSVVEYVMKEGLYLDDTNSPGKGPVRRVAS